MPLIIPPGFCHAVYSMALSGDSEPIVTTMGHDMSDYAGDGVELANRLFTDFSTSIMPVVSNQYTLEFVTVYVGQDGPAPLVYESTEDVVVGSISAAPCPQNCAWLLRKRTDLAGRRGRGRCYIPGIREDEVSAAGLLGDVFLGNLQDAADAWYEDLTESLDPNNNVPPVVLHRSEGAGVEPAPTPITSFTVDSRIVTQRKRLRK